MRPEETDEFRILVADHTAFLRKPKNLKKNFFQETRFSPAGPS